jgi:hypothetical protein
MTAFFSPFFLFSIGHKEYARAELKHYPLLAGRQVAVNHNV